MLTLTIDFETDINQSPITMMGTKVTAVGTDDDDGYNSLIFISAIIISFQV